MLAVSVIIFIIEILALCFFIYAKYFSKKIRYTRTIFTTTVFLVNFAIYYIAYCYNKGVTGNGNYLLGVGMSIASTMGTFMFRMSYNDVSTLVRDVPFYLYTFIMGYALGLFTTVSFIVDAFRYRIINSIRYHKMLSHAEINYVVGDGFDQRNYIRDYPNTIILLPMDTPKEKINSLIKEGYCVYAKLNKDCSSIMKMKKNKNKKYVFVIFDDKDTDMYLRAIKAFKEATNKENTYLYLEVKYEKVEYLKSVLLTDEMSKLHISLFNRYENMANGMCMNVPLTTFLPKEFINEDTTIKADKKINVFILGFGWANQEIYKKLLINNQFVEQDDKFYKAHLVNYHIFDVTGDIESIYLKDGIEELYETLNENKKEYFDIPERVSNSFFYNDNLTSPKTLRKIENIVKDKDSMNYFFIAFGDNYQNLQLTSELYERIRKYNYHFYVKNTELSLSNPVIKNITYFGNLYKYLVHDRIVTNELYSTAIKVNDAYVGHETTLEDLLKRDFIKIYSNYFQAMNIRHKYHLLGYDIISKDKLRDDDQIISKEVFNERIKFDSIKSYDDYFKRSPLVAMTYLEHLHWNSEYLVYGYKPLKISDYVIDNGRLIEQDVPNKLHGAILSYKGLDERAKHILKLLQANGNKDKVLFSETGQNAVEVYRYDYQFLAMSYDFLTKDGNIIIRKR